MREKIDWPGTFGIIGMALLFNLVLFGFIPKPKAQPPLLCGVNVSGRVVTAYFDDVVCPNPHDQAAEARTRWVSTVVHPSCSGFVVFIDPTSDEPAYQARECTKVDTLPPVQARAFRSPVASR